MKAKEVTTKFQFSFAHLKQKGDELLGLIDRDMAEFATRGMTPARRTAYIAAKDAFENYPSDETLDATKQEATAAKNAARAAVELQVGVILTAAARAFREGSARYKSFGDPALTRLSDEQLWRNTKTTITAATANLPALAAEGVTAAKITALTNANRALDDAIDAQAKAINDRDISTEGRALAANALYDLMVSYSDTGRNIWQATSEAKYNDYVIYDTPSGAPEGDAPTPGS